MFDTNHLTLFFPPGQQHFLFHTRHFVQKSPPDGIAAFAAGILRDNPGFRQRFISVHSRLTPEE